jgi:hypothetical protein
MVVILDSSGDFLAVCHLYAHLGAVLDQLFQVANLFQRLFRRARTLTLLSRNVFSYRFLRVCWGSTETPPSCEEAEKLSASP